MSHPHPNQPPPHTPAPPDGPTLTLNRSEWLYVACEGPLGQLNQPYLLRFDGPVQVADVRQAVRRMLTAFPRLRAVLEPTARRFRLRVLPDDDRLDTLLDQALRLERIDLDDPAALAGWHERVLNEPMALQRGLGLRVHVALHATRPVVIFTVHHLLADGRSVVACVQALLRLLNGLPIEDEPLSSHSMLPAVLPERWWQWPSRLWAAWRAEQAAAAERRQHDIVRLPTRASQRYLSTGVMHHDLECLARDLSAQARQRGGSANSLLMAAVGTALLERAGLKKRQAALIRVSVDLRRYFPEGQAPGMGNHVATLDLLLPATVPEADRVRWLDQRMRDGLERFKQRSMVLPLLPYEWLGLMRSHDYTRLIHSAKRHGRLPRLSFHASNIGAVDAFNPPGATLKVDTLFPAVSGAAPLGGFFSLAGRQFMVTTHQRDEYEDRDLQDLVRRTRLVLHRWLNPEEKASIPAAVAPQLVTQ